MKCKIAVEIESNHKKLNQNKLHLFEPMLIDEAGKEYSVDPLSESRNELKCYGKTDGKITGIKSSGIYYEINAYELSEEQLQKDAVKITLPQMNESIILNKEIEIQGVKLLIKKISLNPCHEQFRVDNGPIIEPKDEISIEIESREVGTQLEELFMIPLQHIKFESFGHTVGTRYWAMQGDFSQYAGKEISLGIMDAKIVVPQEIDLKLQTK